MPHSFEWSKLRNTQSLAPAYRPALLIHHTVVYWTINIVLLFTFALSILQCVFVQIVNRDQGEI